MPRQDVPYGGAICRLRERIAEIWDKLGEKLHTINGVPGDGDGNVKIVSGSSAVVINNDPTQNEIEVSLDTSQLPAAAVSSVNGQTGAVALDAGDIPSDGNSDVQSDIDALQTMDGALQGNINAEALARQGADATLQTNINAATASIPGAAAAAVAADNTIVRTSGNQNIADIKTVATETTGTYSQQIANSQKVKAELDNYATMVRTVNNQIITGIKQSGSFFICQNVNITNKNMVIAQASGYGLWHYGGVFLTCMIRDQLYLVKLQSGSTAPIHNVTVVNLASLTVETPASLTWNLGYLERNGLPYLVLQGISGNKTATVRYLGGSQGGTQQLLLDPIVPAEAEATETITYFW